jgi:hypothetical protein
VKITNKGQIQRWIDDWGLDSDFVRVRVLGLPPSVSAFQLIPTLVVEEAQRRRDVHVAVDEPLIMGVDVARHGGDSSVIAFRKGRDATIIPWFRQEYTPNIITFAEHVGDLIMKHKVDACFVDGGGLGAGVYDRLDALGFGGEIHADRGSRIFNINFGSKVSDDEFFNMRSLMWGRMAKWVYEGKIPTSAVIKQDLVQQEFHIDRSTRETRLVSKEDMAALGLASPDEADALALTFAARIPLRIVDAGTPDYRDIEQAQMKAKGGRSWHPFDRLPQV